MDALEGCTGLTTLNGYDKFQGILDGGLAEFYDGGHELALAVGRFLPRSASTLTTLDLRRVLSMDIAARPCYLPHSAENEAG